MVLNIYWTNKIKNEILYGELEILSNKIRRRRLKFAGHFLRREDEVVSNLVMWQPIHGTIRRGRPPDSYIHKDSGAFYRSTRKLYTSGHDESWCLEVNNCPGIKKKNPKISK